MCLTDPLYKNEVENKGFYALLCNSREREGLVSAKYWKYFRMMI